MKQLVLGGARSGKSAFAEKQALASEKKVIYIATATANDEEMQRRIMQHKKQRPKHWHLVEEPLLLAQALLENDSSEHCILVDCLTLWLSNSLADHSSHEKQSELLEIIPQLKSEIIFVSNEVGQGIVPLGEITRKFVDESGRLHQRLAKVCDQVYFITAGIAQTLK